MAAAVGVLRLRRRGAASAQDDNNQLSVVSCQLSVVSKGKSIDYGGELPLLRMTNVKEVTRRLRPPPPGDDTQIAADD